MATPYDLDGRRSLRLAIPPGLQHVLAMFVGNLTPLLVITGAANCALQAELQITLLQNAMIIAGLVTLLQLYPIGPVGGRLPIVMGTSSGFIGVCASIAASIMAGDASLGVYAYGAILGASLIGGIFEGVLGFILKPLRRFFPPVVTGTAVIMFASIVVSGIQLIMRQNMTSRTISIVAVSLGLSFGLGSTGGVLSKMPQWIQLVFGGSGIVPAALIAIILNVLIPEDKPAQPDEAVAPAQGPAQDTETASLQLHFINGKERTRRSRTNSGGIIILGKFGKTPAIMALICSGAVSQFAKVSIA